MKSLYQRISYKAKNTAENESLRALVLYFLLFLLLMYPIRHGAGQFWDWTFPYFKEHLPNFFLNRSLSWTEMNFGKPLDYSTDYIMRFLISLFSFVNPEAFRYYFYAAIFALSSFGVFLISKRNLNSQWSFFLGLAALINPAVLYKFTAGHFNYFVSYLIFIYLIYFLWYKFEANLKSAIIAGLALAFIGIQIQFYFLGFMLLVLFFCFKREKFKVRYLAVICLIILSVNLIWLSNFIFGGSEVAKLSSEAAKVSFSGSKGTDLFNIFSFSFSRATLISKFYENQYLIFFMLFYIFLFLFMLVNRIKDKIDFFFLALLMALTALSTGVYNSFQIRPISVLYPMFRESGHFAPLVVMLLILAIARRIKDNRILNLSFFCFVLAFLLINSYKFYQHSPALNFPDIRRSFDDLVQNNKKDDSPYRILSYPFFDQYSFKDNQTKEINNSLMNNSGHDSFMTYAGKDFVSNIISPDKFKDSLQYRLLKSGDIDILKPYNVKYIYNLSNIYESNYDKYVPGYIYDNDTSLIKNNDNFFNELISQNPDKLEKIGDNILKIKDYLPRIYATDSIFGFNSLSDLESKTKFIKSVFGKNPDYTIINEQKKSPFTSVVGLFDSIEENNIDYSKKLISAEGAEIFNGKSMELYINSAKTNIYAKKQGNKLALYKKAFSNLKLNGIAIGEDKTELMREIYLDPNINYYIGSGTQLMAIQEGKEQNLGVVDRDMSVKLYYAGSRNLIPNASFQDGLWDKEVGDCNNYDDNPILDMKLEQNEAVNDNIGNGNNFLQLGAIRHVACTTNTFDVEEGRDYLFSFDYQSPNAKTAGYYLEFNDADKTVVREQVFISDADWHNYSRRIQTPPGATSARLYLYAYSTDEKTEIVNRYGNFSLVQLEAAKEVNIEYQPEFKNEKINLSGNNTFEYEDPDYGYANIIPNASMENGLWEERVSDCNNYDDNPKIETGLAEGSASDGVKSLELRAMRHNACTGIAFPVKEYSDYLFSFDYQSPNAKTAGYYLEFNDALRTVHRDLLDINDGNWHKFTEKIAVPEGATSARLYVYAYEKDAKEEMVNRYDNFKFVELPDLSNKYYLVSDSGLNLENPKGVDFEAVDPTKKIVHIKAASKPFYLFMSESYHLRWQLEMNNAEVQGIFLSSFPVFVRPDKISDDNHLELDGGLNAWYVDINDLCRAKNLCTMNPDGTYNLEMVIEFAPQRWFNVGLLTSGAALLLSLGYLAWDRVKRKN